MTILPADILYGCVDGRFVLAIGDSADPDSNPDMQPAQGSITFQPLQQRIISTAGGGISTTVLPQPITCTLDEEGRLLDPAGERTAWFIQGQYRVTFQLTGVALPEVTIEVDETHTDVSPLDLSGELPPIPEPGTVWVVSEEAYLLSVAEANRAEEAAERAELAASGEIINDTATSTGSVWSSQKVSDELSGKAASSHTHSIANITSLETALDDKAPLVHSHDIGHVSGLQGALDGKAAISDSTTASTTTWSSTKIAAEIGEGGSSGQVGIYYTGTSWPSRPVMDDPLMWVSTKHAAAPQPTDMDTGDMWIRHPDALEAL